jgi:hypothetical protein
VPALKPVSPRRFHIKTTKPTKYRKMKNTILHTAIAALLMAGAPAFAGNSATQTVSYEVQAINELSVSSESVSLVVNSATPGSAPNAATNSSTSYSITTNETGRKIVGALNSDLPAGVTLSVTLAAPNQATSLGKVALTSTAVDLVSGISTLNETGKSIAYELAATSAAGVVPSASKTVTLTIMADDSN